jgi:hypothetical protein
MLPIFSFLEAFYIQIFLCLKGEIGAPRIAVASRPKGLGSTEINGKKKAFLGLNYCST